MPAKDRNVKYTYIYDCYWFGVNLRFCAKIVKSKHLTQFIVNKKLLVIGYSASSIFGPSPHWLLNSGVKAGYTSQDTSTPPAAAKGSALTELRPSLISQFPSTKIFISLGCPCNFFGLNIFSLQKLSTILENIYILVCHTYINIYI